MPIHHTDKPLKKRAEHDFYPTPIELCRIALQRLPMRNISIILDAGAGAGVWGEVAREKWTNNARIIGVEIRKNAKPHPAYDQWITQNYRLLKDLPPVDLVMGNPPFKEAEAFIRIGYELIRKRTGYMVQLLPLDFLAGQKREKGLWRECKPTHIQVLSDRPSFTGDGGTDMTEYMLCYWDLGVPSKQTTINWLNWGELSAKSSHVQRSLIEETHHNA